MANDPQQDGYKDWSEEQLSGLPGAPKRGQNGGYVYGWRPQPYQDVLSDTDVQQQQQLQNYRQQYGGALTADDDAGALAQMSGKAPLAGTNTYAPSFGSGGSPTSVMDTWLAGGTKTGYPTSQVNTTITPTADPRRDQLYDTLLTRSQQSLDVNPNDPTIAGQVNAYRAEQERGARNYIDAQAEAGGPYSNLNSERRLASEHAAQATGAMQGQLMQNELMARRDEIAQALGSMQGMLSQDQQLELQRQLAQLDAAIAQRGQDFNYNLGSQGLSNELLRAMLQNQQYYAGLGSENDRFAAQLGFNSADRAAYWDALNRGLI